MTELQKIRLNTSGGPGVRHLPLGSVVFCEQRFHRDVDPVEMLLFLYGKQGKKNEKKFAFTPNNWEKYDKIQLEGAKNFSVSLIINPKTSFYL